MYILKKVFLGVTTLCFILVASLVAQLHDNSQAVSTLSGTNEVVPIATTDSQPLNSTDTTIVATSQDGDVILFRTTATNLPSAGGTNYVSHGGGTYAYNIKTNSTSRIDTSASGVLPNDSGATARMSENGRYVFFRSPATNLIDGSTQYDNQLYIRDLQLGTITAITNSFSTSSQNYQPQITTLDFPISISNDGRLALLATRYTSVGYPYNYNIMLGDKKTGTFVWTSLGQAFANTTTDPTNGSMSCDGSFIAYEKSGAIYTVDARNGAPTASSASLFSSGSSVSALTSCNGNYLLYATTNRTEISPTPTGMSSYMHLVEYNRLTGTRQYIDSSSSGTFDSNHITYNSSSYASQPENLFSASVADTGDVVFKYNGNFYLKHLSDGSGTLESVAKTSSGSYVNISQSARVTGDGRYLLFIVDPYSLGLTSSASTPQIIRTKTGL